jgi:hypothetical protein
MNFRGPAEQVDRYKDIIDHDMLNSPTKKKKPAFMLNNGEIMCN